LRPAIVVLQRVKKVAASLRKLKRWALVIIDNSAT
jgi:hypothetical protein